MSKVSDTSANLYVKYGGGDDEEEDDGDMADIDDAISDYESDAGDSDEQQSDSGGYDNPVHLLVTIAVCGSRYSGVDILCDHSASLLCCVTVVCETRTFGMVLNNCAV